MGWQEDCLTKADVVVHLTGGFTQQQAMACERLARESCAFDKLAALHVTVNPAVNNMDLVAPSVPRAMKEARIDECEAMVKANCPHHECLRVEADPFAMSRY